MNYNNLCYRCFCEKPIREKPCPKCGYQYTPDTEVSNRLIPGTLLKNRYVAGAVLGAGGFGITYKCLDTDVGGVCAIKEYFPTNIAARTSATRFVSVAEENLERYNRIMRRFVEEAELVRVLHHRNVITIYDSFFENNTAYYVMEYCDGIDLCRYTNNFTQKLEYEDGMNLLYQVMNGLEYIHSKGILHRDIAPDNIYVTKNKTVKILDFGSARSEMDQINRELSVIVKTGYAPIEQYGGRGKQGPYTDVYALGATFYHLFTSVMPMESTQRVAEDNMTEFSRLRPDLPDNLKYCIERAMSLTTAGRISSITEMKGILGLGNNSVRTSERPVATVNQLDYNKKEAERQVQRRTKTHFLGKVPTLIGVSGPLAGKVYPVSDRGIMLGRDSSFCQVAIPSSQTKVSRIHCYITFNKATGVFVLNDRNSTYGTYLASGSRISYAQPVTLKSGDRFYLSTPENTFEVR